MQGRMKTAGDLGAVLDVLAAVDSRELSRAPAQAAALRSRQRAPARRTVRARSRSPRGRGTTGRGSAGAWSSTRPRPVVGAHGAELVGVDRRGARDLGDARLQLEQRPLDAPAGARRARATKWSGNTTPSSAARRRNGKPATRSVVVAGQPQREPEVDRQLEVDVEELGPQLAARRGGWSRWLTSKPHTMARSIWARHSRRTSSRSAWSHSVLDRAGEPAVAVEQRGRVGDRPPAVAARSSALRVRCTPMSSPR